MEDQRMKFAKLIIWKPERNILFNFFIFALSLTIPSLSFSNNSFTTPASSSTKISEYETPPILKASQYLPSKLLKSKYHKVEEDIDTFGFTNSYRINSKFFISEVRGDDLLRERIQEVHALATLLKMKKTNKFIDAATRSALSPVSFAKNLILRPVDTISGIPQGIWRFFSRVGEMTGGKRGQAEDGISKELIGFSAVKRKIAHQLGVDVYSTNRTLQKELNSVSWASFSGGFVVSMAITPLRVLKLTKTANKMTKILRDKAPEDLRKLNRAKLKKFISNDKLVEKFLEHPYFSPRHETFLVAALENMQGTQNLDKFVYRAYKAQSFEDAFIFQRIAEILDKYHNEVSPIQKIAIEPSRNFPVAITKDNKLVIALLVDYAVWSKIAAKWAQDLTRANNRVNPNRKIELLITGTLSPRARNELKSLGISVKEKVLD